MKKRISFVMMWFVLLFLSVKPVHAADFITHNGAEEADSTVIYLEDGGKIVISPVIECDAGNSIKAASNTITRSREAYYSNASGKKEWIYTLTATFSYEYGVSATCTNASYSQSIYDSNWTFSNGSATKSGNTAHGKGKYIKKELFVTTQNIDVDVSLTCDVYGNVKRGFRIFNICNIIWF